MGFEDHFRSGFEWNTLGGEGFDGLPISGDIVTMGSIFHGGPGRKIADKVDFFE